MPKSIYMVRSLIPFFALVLSGFYLQAYWVMRERYNEVPELTRRLELSEERLAQEKFRLSLQEEQIRAFKMDVAATLPPSLKGVVQPSKLYQMRNLASVMKQGRNESVTGMVAETLFSTGKILFRDGHYDRSNRLFKKLIERYGYATQAIEAHFLLAEGQYQMGDMEGATNTIHSMIELFPESELTGFAMIRLGQIFESRDRYEDAVQIYRTVLRSYPYRSVASQAELKLRHMEP